MSNATPAPRLPIGDSRRLQPGPYGGTILFDLGADAPEPEVQLRALGLCGEAVWLELPPIGLPCPKGPARTWYEAPPRCEVAA